jgi:hypothetical protein
VGLNVPKRKSKAGNTDTHPLPRGGTDCTSQEIDYGRSIRCHSNRMAGELDSMEVTNEAKELLDERWAAFLADPSSALTIEGFRKKMKARRS